MPSRRRDFAFFWQAAPKPKVAPSFWSVQGGGDSGSKAGDGAEEVEGFEEVKKRSKGRKIHSEDGSFAFDGVGDPVSPRRAADSAAPAARRSQSAAGAGGW